MKIRGNSSFYKPELIIKYAVSEQMYIIFILMELIKTISFVICLSIIVDGQVVIPASSTSKSATTLTYISGTDFSLLNTQNSQPSSTSKQTTSSTQNQVPAPSTVAQLNSLPSDSSSSTPSSQAQQPSSSSNTGSSSLNTKTNTKSIVTLPPLNPSNTPQPDQITPNSYTQSSQLQGQALKTNPSASNSVNTGYNSYLAATTTFSSFSQLKKTCNSQTQLKHVAFKQYSTQYYLTSNIYFLSLVQSTSPSNQQLFTAIQNIDCTWSFQTSEGLYLSLNAGFSYLALSSVLSTGQRFYLQRKQDWICIESASSYRYFWTVSNGIVLINLNQASRFTLQMWPDLNVGWN